MTDVVPLPDYLASCGCPAAPMRHKTTCATAIEFDKIDLRDRPEYAEGRRFAAITWDFPLTISGSVRIDVALDPVGVIVAHADEYAAFVDVDGDGEKPIQFLCHLIEEQIDVSIWFGGRRLSRDTSYLDDLTESTPWTAADTALLEERLANRPDPNQGTLDLGGPDGTGL